MSKDDLTLGVMYPSKYLKCEDLRGKNVTVTIADVSIDDVMMTGGSHEKKVVLKLARTPKLLIAGRTNGYALGVLISPHAREWVDKRIVLCPDVDTFGREDVPCIRVYGSPDATPERSAAYSRAWRGERKRGKLIARLKQALARLTSGDVVAPPVEPDEPDVADEPGAAHESVEDVFSDEPETPKPEDI